MQKNSIDQRSSLNPVRVPMFEREEKSSGRNDVRRTQMHKSNKPQNQVEGSQIPRPRIRSSSSDRSSIRRSNLKPMGKTPLRQQTHSSLQPMRISNAATPLHSTTTPRVSSCRPHIELPSGSRHRSPSAERASAFGAKGPRKDCRALADKAHQALMLSKIDQYFYEIQQTSLLNTSGSLKPVTLKIFVEATNCLIKILNIKQDLTIGNYTDEIPKVAKKLNYPGAVTKSWLKTANTMHSWPQVLGWLSWLAEVCEAKERAEIAFRFEKIPFVGSDDEEERHRGDFKALLNIYRAWNDEKLDEEAALMEKRVRELIESDVEESIQEELLLRNKEEENAKLIDNQEIEIDEELNALNQILENLKQSESAETEAIVRAEDTAKRVIVQTKELIVKNDELDEQIEFHSVQNAEIMEKIENQKMTMERCQEISKECSAIENNIRQYEKYIKDMENEMYALDLKFASCNQNIRKAILDYNKDVIMHPDCDTGMDIEALKIPETSVLSSDFMDILRIKQVAIINVKETMRKKLIETEIAIASNSDEIIALEENLKILRNFNENYGTLADNWKHSVQQLQRDARIKEIQLRDDIIKLEKDIADLEKCKPDQTNVETATKQLAEAHDKFQAVARRFQFVEKRMKLFFDQFYRVIRNHRNDLGIMLEKFSETPVPLVQRNNSSDSEQQLMSQH